VKLVSRSELQSSPTLLTFFSFFFCALRALRSGSPSKEVVLRGKKRERGVCHQREGKSSEFYIAYFIFAAASFTTYVFAGSVILPFQTNCIAASGSKGAEYCTTLFHAALHSLASPFSLRPSPTLQQVLPHIIWWCKHTNNEITAYSDMHIATNSIPPRMQTHIHPGKKYIVHTHCVL
jgi:hypothetical protein